MSSKAPGSKQRTVFILYIPGGAMLGIIPALILSRIESLTETPTPEMFQVIEGVSTGSILAAGFSMPGMTAKKAAELFVEMGPKFFPNIPGRWAKMTTRNGINIAKHYYDLDPRQSDYLAIHNIKELCKKMRENVDDYFLRSQINEFEDMATERWLTAKSQQNILSLAEQICQQCPELQKYTDAVAELVSTRTFTGRLSIVFKKAAVGVMDGIKNRWAKKEECLFDSTIPEQMYKEMFGDREIGETACSTYISAYDIVNNSVVTFSSLKNDLYSNDPKAPASIRNRIKIWDAVMASTANPFAFRPHITESNLLCSDKAIIHKPRSVKDVLARVPSDTRVVLVIAGTGKHLSKELAEFLEQKRAHEDDNLTEEACYRKKLEVIRDFYEEFGIAGNILLGRELAELEGYTTSEALEDFEHKLGKDNIIDLSPRLSPHTPQERDDFPSRDALDANTDNIKKIINRGRSFTQEEDERIRKLAQMLADNLYLIGKMDKEKYERVCRKIGIVNPDLQADVEKATAGIEKHIASNDNSTGLLRVWRQINRKISNWNWFDNSPPPPRGPRGPGEGL